MRNEWTDAGKRWIFRHFMTAFLSPIRIPLPPPPFRPGLRLAHVSRSRKEPRRSLPKLRRLDDFEFVLQGHGSSLIFAGPQREWIRLEEGTLLFLPPGFDHAWIGLEGEHRAVHFDLHARPELGIGDTIIPLDVTPDPIPASVEPAGVPPRFSLQLEANPSDSMEIPLVTSLPAPQVWQDRLDALIRLHATGGANQLPGAWEVSEIISWGLRQLTSDAARKAPIQDARVRIHELLEANATDPTRRFPSVEWLARQSGLGLTAFRQKFRQVTGETPRTYLERQRMDEAARLLLDGGHPVQTIASLVGYEDPYHFSRVFRRVFGASPRVWRRSRLREVQSPDETG